MARKKLCIKGFPQGISYVGRFTEQSTMNGYVLCSRQLLHKNIRNLGTSPFTSTWAHFIEVLICKYKILCKGILMNQFIPDRYILSDICSVNGMKIKVKTRHFAINFHTQSIGTTHIWHNS